MSRQSFTTLAAAVVTFLASTSAGSSPADNWPTWRGPNATGSALKGSPPLIWSETENIKWKIDLPGEGTSTPVVWGEKMFFQTAIKTDKKAESSGQSQADKAVEDVYKFDLVCIDRNDGHIIWQKTCREQAPHEGHHPDHGFASYSPITDGNHVWVNYGSRGLHCYDLDGNHKWSRDLIQMNTRNSFGEGSSPALAGDTLIVVCDHEGQSKIFAVEKNTGKTIWEKDRDELTNWTTPVVAEANGRMQAIVGGTNAIISYDVATGGVVWTCSGMTQNVIPTPVLGFGRVFCTTGFRGNALLAIELGHTGDLTGTDAVKWKVTDSTTPYVPSPVLYNKKIYLCSGNNPLISCYDAQSGQPYFEKKELPALKGIYASPVAVSGRVYFVGRNGVTQVIAASEVLDVLATNTLDDPIDASPVVVGDSLYLKGKTYLYCIAKQ